MRGRTVAVGVEDEDLLVVDVEDLKGAIEGLTGDTFEDDKAAAVPVVIGLEAVGTVKGLEVNEDEGELEAGALFDVGLLTAGDDDDNADVVETVDDAALEDNGDVDDVARFVVCRKGETVIVWTPDNGFPLVVVDVFLKNGDCKG